MINYKIREELDGAFLFETSSAKAVKISEKNLVKIKTKELSFNISGIDNALFKRELLEDKVRIIRKDRTLLPRDALSAPARVYFELTRECTLRCKTCFNESASCLKEEMSTAKIKKVIDDLDELGTFEIRFTGGEATTRKDFFEIINYAKFRGFYVSLGTNGFYGGKKLDDVADSGIDWFIVSLDGNKKTNDFIRGSGVYDTVLNTLSNFSKTGKRIRLNCVVAKYNVNQVQFLADLCDDYNIESLNLIPLRPYGRFNSFLSDQMLSKKEYRDMIVQINSLKNKVKVITALNLLEKDNLAVQDRIVRKERTCAAGVEATVISPDGFVYGCSYSPASDASSKDQNGRDIFVSGNILETPIDKIWYDSSRWNVFRNLAEFKNPKCLTCGHYGRECVGSCPIMAYYESKDLNTMDPYCFLSAVEEI